PRRQDDLAPPPFRTTRAPQRHPSVRRCPPRSSSRVDTALPPNSFPPLSPARLWPWPAPALRRRPREGREIGGAAGIAARGGALEQLARLGFVLGNARSSREQHAEFDHGRRAPLVGGLAI